MKLVHLEIPSDSDEPTVHDITADFADAELEKLEQYRRLTQRVRNCQLLRRGMIGFQGLTFDTNGLSIRAGTCSDSELYELLHVLRPVTLQKEDASFSKIVSILGSRLTHTELQRYLQLNQRSFQHGEMSLFFQVSINNRLLFHESLLNTWLNGTQYHTDANKASDWVALEEALGQPNARAVVMSQLRSKVVAIFNIDYIVRQVLDAPKHVNQPECLLQASSE